MKHFLKAAAVVSIGAALAGQSVRAQNTYNAGDMLLGFELAGQAHDVVFDLGSASQFNATSSFDLSTVGYSASLVLSEFGVTSFSGIHWSVTGYNPTIVGNANDNALFVTKGRTSAFSASTPFSNVAASSSLSSASAKIDNLGAGFSQSAGGNLFLSGTATAINSSSANSITKIQGTAGKLGGTFQGNTLNVGTTDLEGSDLYIVRSVDNGAAPGAAQGDGFFTLNPTTGDMTYNVPEPSTYALAACAGVVFLALGRKFRRQAA